MGMGAWLQFAEAVVVNGGADLHSDLVDSVVALGLTESERAELTALLRDRDDPVAAIVADVMSRAADRQGGSDDAEEQVRELTDRVWASAEPQSSGAEPPPPPPVPLPPSIDDVGPPDTAVPEDTAAEPPPVFRGGDGQEPTPTAYPRIDLATGTSRPEVVVVDRPFTATIGLGARKSQGLVSSGQVRGTGPLDIVAVYDPTSLQPTGPTSATLEVTADEPYPSIDLTFTARYLEDAPPTRRIGVQYLRDGQVVGMAWRNFVAVDDESRVAEAVVPRPRESQLLDLAPLAGQEPPDLVVAVCATDADRQAWVWTAYAPDPALTVPDRPNVARLDDDTATFALETRRAIQFSTDRYSDYLALAGRAKRIGRAVPAGIAEAVTALATQDGRTTAPSILLLTEEVFVPWELATIDDLATPWGGSSPFLGSHVAISRWPLTETKPRPTPTARVEVSSGAVVVADYTGVAGFDVLPEALAEADRVVDLLDPPMARIDATLPSVIDLMRGEPAASIIHVALHGTFDVAGGNNEGIVLVDDDGEGTRSKVYLTPTQLSVAELNAGPFVFLNCCQVGADRQVLGSYGGFASTLLEIGAGGVVAPLWNVDDDVAATLADEFYAATWVATPESRVSPAEALRRIRATYTEDAVRAETPGITATLVAFQAFGHPRLSLDSPSPGDTEPTRG